MAPFVHGNLEANRVDSRQRRSCGGEHRCNGRSLSSGITEGRDLRRFVAHFDGPNPSPLAYWRSPRTETSE